jgi:hypothetical protein
VRFIFLDCGAYVLFGSLIECWCIMRPISQLHLKQLFSNNKVSIKSFSILLSLWIFPLFICPCYDSLGYSLSY